MKNLSVFNLECFFLGWAYLREVRHSISCCIGFFLTLINSKIVSKELLGLADLTRAQVFCIHELTEVIIVNKDKDLIIVVFQIIAPSLNDENDSQELLIISLILSLSGDHFLRKKGYWVLWTNFGFGKIWILIFVDHLIGKKLIQMICSYLT